MSQSVGFRILLLTSAVFIVQQWRCSYCSVGEGRLPQCLSLPMLDWFLDTVWESLKMLSVCLVVVLTTSMSSLVLKGKGIGNSFPGEAWEPVASTTVPRIVTQVKWGKQYANQQSVGRHVMSWGLERKYGCSSRDRRLDLSRYFHQTIHLRGTESWTAQQHSEP